MLADAPRLAAFEAALGRLIVGADVLPRAGACAAHGISDESASLHRSGPPSTQPRPVSGYSFNAAAEHTTYGDSCAGDRCYACGDRCAPDKCGTRRGAWRATDECGGGFCAWATDYPKAERQFLTVLRRLTNLDASPSENAVRLDDPAIRAYPFIYAVEVGYMSLSSREVTELREYLLSGGFMVVDDFWGSYEWRNFESQMRRVFPEYPIVEIPMDHPVMSAFYDVKPNSVDGRAAGRAKLAAIESYNKEDVDSTRELHDWLEQQRARSASQCWP